MNFKTAFAPAEVVSAETLQQQYHHLTNLSEWKDVFSRQDVPLAILNAERQVVIANSALLRLLGGAAFSDVIGKRPGELLHCEVAERTLLGCGTAAECGNCLALRTIQTAVRINRAQSYAVVIQTNGKYLELELSATAVDTPLGRFTVVQFG